MTTVRFTYVLTQIIFVTVAIFLSFTSQCIYDGYPNIHIAWFATVNGSIIQILKTVLIPWILLIVPLDIFWAVFSKGQGRLINTYSRIEESITANLAAMIGTMVAIAIACTGVYYSKDRNLKYSNGLYIVIFMIFIILGLGVLRHILFNFPVAARWLLLVLVLASVLYMFIYLSYVSREDMFTGFWLDSHVLPPPP
jgi:hypothetical protein